MDTVSDSPQVIKEVLAGNGMSLIDAAKIVPSYRPGRPTSATTLWRWIKDGVKLQGGEVLRLEACRVSGHWVTTEAALGRFIRHQTTHMEAHRKPAAGPEVHHVA